MREVLIGAVIGLLGFAMYQGYNVYPLLFLAGAAALISQTPLGRNLVPRKQAVVAAANPTPVAFDEIGGQASAKRELIEALEFIANHQRVRRFGIRPLKGILLTGPPGTGKTLLAKAAAQYMDSVFLSASGSEFIEIYAGVGAQRVRELFRRARDLARQRRKNSAIIFIDEIEVLGGKRGQHTSHLEYDQTLNQLLVEMDGLNVDEDVRVLLVGATNRVDLLDPALLRPGRFDRIVNVDLPDREGRLAILALHTRGKPLDPSVDLDRVARETFGFSGAHLESVCNEAAILAMRAGSETILQQHLTEAIDKVILGERLDRRPNPAERERIAVHEAGHAIVGEVLQPGSVSSITVSPRGNALGYVRHAPEDDRYLYTSKLLEDQICGLLAGAVAEDVIFGNRSTGATNDFARSVDLARRIVHAGLSDLGIVDPDSLAQSDLNQAVGDILRKQEQRCRGLLEARKAALRALAAQLAEREVVPGDRFREILQDHPPVEPPAPVPTPSGSAEPPEAAA